MRLHRRTRAGRPNGRRLAFRRTLLAAGLLPVVAGGFAFQSLAGGDGSRVFYEVFNHVLNERPDTVSADALYEMAARGMLERLGDPYAELYSARQLAEFQRESLRNRYGGLGMGVERLEDTVTVTRVYPGTPAEGAGVRVGDRIVEVDGTDVVGWETSQVTARLLGTPGTGVNVVFRRAGAPRPLALQRAVIRIPVVPFSTVLEGGIGYVPLQQFSENARGELAQAVASVRKAGATSLVLDLRGNGGGSLNQAIRISNLFVDRGDEIVRVVYRNVPTEVYVATEEPMIPRDLPVVVLTDGGAASASEIVAGALQDHDRAVVVGETTFGKGLVQDLFQLDGGWALKLTTGRWYTPSGRSIQRDHGAPVERDPRAPRDSTAPPRVYRSGAGRPLQGGGGITPDVVVVEDTLIGAERALMQALARNGGAANQALTALALREVGRATEAFRSTPAHREELHRRMARAGLTVDRATFDAAPALVDRLIEQRVASVALGDLALFRRGVPRDAQLQAAMGLLRGARSQQEAFARVVARPGA